jgi:hypothetical protein
MSKSTKQSQSMLVSAMLILAAAIALNSPTTFSQATQTVASDTTISTKFHRHGPPGKGFYHTERHSKQTAVKSCPAQLKQYGPPSTRLRTRGQSTACRSTTLMQGGVVK